MLLSDQDYCLENMRTNVRLNKAGIERQGSAISVLALDWFDEELPAEVREVEFILGADVVWLEELIEPLVSTIDRIFKGAGRISFAYIAYQSRSKRADEKLFAAMKRHRLSLQIVPATEHHPQFTSNKIRIYQIERADASER